MQRRYLVAIAALFFACDPTIKQVSPPTGLITAEFDPSQSPPLVPVPNDLATDPATGLLAITPPADAAGPDLDFYAYLNTLDGYPNNAAATAAFDGKLKSDSVTTADVLVYDITNTTFVKIALTPIYADTMADSAPGSITVPPPATGWVAGHVYAVAIVGGTTGVKGAMGETVIGSPTWALLRSENSLLSCDKAMPPKCQAATALIPSTLTDPAARLADQLASATQLEGLRLKYAPVINQLINTDKIARTDIVLAWTFKIDDLAQVAFTPPTSVPLPNDLVIDPVTHLVNVPMNPAYSPAYQEFILNYLNTLDGFPTASTASVGIIGGDLDPASIVSVPNPDAGVAPNIVAISLTGQDLGGFPTVTYDATSKQLNIAPPNGSWGKNNEIAIAVIGGAGGIQRISSDPAVPGDPVTASAAWALVRSASSLVDCKLDCTNPAMPVAPAGGCNVVLTAAPLPLGQAAGLECLREIYAPVLDAFASAGFPREVIDIAWTFHIDSIPEATFDPANSIIPFPNNVLRTTGSNPHLTLPVSPDAPDLQKNLIAGMNTLDGFSLTAPAVSESSDTMGAIDVGEIDPTTLSAATVGFLKLAGPGPTPQVTPCFNCRSSPQPDGGVNTGPQQLQFVPDVPLAEQTTYGAFMTTGLKDKNGVNIKPSTAFAIVRLANPICDTTKTPPVSLIPILSDLQACGTATSPGLETLRAGLKPMIDGLAVGGIQRNNLALAWAYTTQTTLTELSNRHDAVAGTLPSTLSSVFPVPTASVMPSPLSCSAAPNAAFPPCALASNVYMGTMTLPFALTSPLGTITPPVGWQQQKALFLLTVPNPAVAGPVPATGWPVVLFGHGLGGNRLQMIAIANTLASAGLATIAVDVVWHGDRSTCTGSAAVLAPKIPGATDDYACTTAAQLGTDPTKPDPVHAMCNAAGRCVARSGTGAACTNDATCIATHQGFCTAAGTCEGADFFRGADGAPVISAWNFLNLSNLFASRDNFRHFTLDLAQVVHVLKDANLNTTLATVGAPALNGAKLNYAGMSLGGFNGTLFSAVNHDVTNVALNVPGSDQALVLLASPAFQPQRDGFLAQLAAIGVTPGTPAFDDLFVLIKTIFDPADPQNYILTSVNTASPAARKVYVSWILNDFVVPNVTTEELLAAAVTGAKMPIVEQVMPSFTTLPPASRHGYVLNYADPVTTLTQQGRIAHFIVTGAPQ